MLGFCLLLSSSDLHIFIPFFCFTILWLERIQSKARLIHICNSNISSRSEMLSSWIVLLLKLTEVTSPRILSHNSKRAMYVAFNSKKVFEDNIFRQQNILQLYSGVSKYHKYFKQPSQNRNFNVVGFYLIFSSSNLLVFDRFLLSCVRLARTEPPKSS